eukprot:1616222-Pyramimonas_sp.AAC.1
MLTQLRDLGISFEFVDLGLYDKATKFRVIMRRKALDVALYELDGLSSGLADDEFIPARMFSGWRCHSMMRTTNEDAAGLANSPIDRTARLIQAKVHRHFRSVRMAATPLLCLSVRISRWSVAASLEDMFRLRTRLRAVERATCTHLATNVLRVLSRG